MKRILLIGQTGVGKSTFINALLGYNHAGTSDYEAYTKIVEHYSHRTRFGKIQIVDTPGLSEYNEIQDNVNVGLIGKYFFENDNSIDFILYLTPLSEKRFRQSEKVAIKKLTDITGGKIWSKTWLVFTFAGLVSSNRDKAVSNRTNHIVEFLTETTSNTNYPFKEFKNIAITDNLDFNWWKKSEEITLSYSKSLNNLENLGVSKFNLKMSRRRKQ